MSKKKMSLTHYRPAVLRTGYRWYIEFYQTNPSSGVLQRFRETHDLNRIKSLKERRQQAMVIIAKINSRLPYGYPYEIAEEVKLMPLAEAIEKIVQIKMQTHRKKSGQTFKSKAKILLEHVDEKGLADMPVSQFDRYHALQFLDAISLEREIGPVTYNNYIATLRTLFMELKERGYINENPFSGLKNKKTGAKRRRAFSKQEQALVASYILRNEHWLSLGMLLQYYCFIRPSELRRLRIQMIRLEDSMIYLPGDATKNHEFARLTINDKLKEYLSRYNLDAYPANYLIFGQGLLPHPAIPVGANTMNNRHKSCLQKLKKTGLLKNIEGLSFYSWKDTGAMALFKRKVNILEIMRQLRHKDLSTTQRYCESLYQINYEIKGLDNDIRL
jgi:integrase/recombinase XerD